MGKTVCIPVADRLQLHTPSGTTCKNLALGDCLMVDEVQRPLLAKITGVFTTNRCGRLIMLGVAGSESRCSNQIEVKGFEDARVSNGYQETQAFSDDVNNLTRSCPAGQQAALVFDHPAEGFEDAATGKPSHFRGVGVLPSKCAAGWKDEGLFCGVKCPHGYLDMGLSCAKPKSYGRGVGYIGKHRCEHHHTSCEKWGLLWYPKCTERHSVKYHNFGCCVCTIS